MAEQPIVAIIPARGGSKRIPRKNLVPLNGKPLVAHTIEHGLGARQVDAVYVSTEDLEIADVARRWGAQVIERPVELAVDTASSESALRHAMGWLEAQQVEPRLVVFLQCTSPVRASDDIDRAIDTLHASAADSLLSVCKNTQLFWGRRESGDLYSINYDFRRRKREQDLDVQYRENGSIYLFKPWVLDTFNNRLGGTIAVYEMGYWHSFQIDTPEDVELCSWILGRQGLVPAVTLPERVELLVLDFDGVMTNNRVWVTEDGAEAVACNRSDGMGLAMLRAHGIQTVVLSTESNPVVAARCRKLGVPYRQGVADKETALRGLAAERNVDLPQIVYVGNDVNDLPCLRLVGCGVAVADAHPLVRAQADLVLNQQGGHGAVRELCDMILARRRRYA